MGFFQRDPPPPDWCALREAKHYSQFKALVRETLGNVTLRDGGACAVTAAGETFDVASLARSCASLPLARWAEFIPFHVTRIREGWSQTKAVLEGPYAQAKARLRVRVATPGTGGQGLKIDHGDLSEELAVEIPGGHASVGEGALRHWGVEATEAFRVARENLSASAPAWSAVPGAPVALEQVVSDDHFSAARVFSLQEDEHGIILAVPTPGIAFAHQVRNNLVANALPDFYEVAHAQAAQSHHPISTDLFWLHGGRFTRLPLIAQPNGQHLFSPPPEFMAWLQGLPTA